MVLEKMIRDCLLAVQNDPQHDLRLGLRRRLWCSFNETGANNEATIGHRRRVKLSALAVEKVLPIWEAAFPADRTPHEALDIVKELLVERITSAAALAARDRMDTQVEEVLYYYEGDQSVVMVGIGAMRMLTGALWDGLFGCDRTNDALADRDVDAYQADASFFCAVAYSGGAIWETGSDPKKRLEFWTWWLKDAVNAALLES